MESSSLDWGMSNSSSNLSDIKKAGIPTKLIETLTKEGWKFWVNTWEDKHKFDRHTDLHFQSPNMRSHASIDRTYFGELTREYFFKREAFAVALDWADGAFNDKLVIQNPIAEALREYFAATKDCKLDFVYSTSIDFKVKVNPKEKNKPKKVKVLITIE